MKNTKAKTDAAAALFLGRLLNHVSVLDYGVVREALETMADQEEVGTSDMEEILAHYLDEVVN